MDEQVQPQEDAKPILHEQPQKYSQKQGVTLNDVLMILMSLLYLWEWWQSDGQFTVSRIIAVVVLTVWWTMFVTKVVKQ